MLMSCDAVRHSMFVLVSTLGFLFTHFYDEMLKNLVEDFTFYSSRNKTFPENSVTRIIHDEATNNFTSNLTISPETASSVKCQKGYKPEDFTKHSVYGNYGNKAYIYNTTGSEQDPRYECMKVALDSNYSFVVCVNEIDPNPRHWDQGQIEHLYTWLRKDKDIGYIDMSGGNGFYALAAAAMNHSTLVVGSDNMNVKRIHKGIKLSHLERYVVLVNANITEYNETINNTCINSTECTQNTNTISVDNLAYLIDSQKVILRVHFNELIIKSFLKSELFFSQLCVPFIITEVETSLLNIESKVSFIQLANVFIYEQGYRPFTENGIALTLNQVLEWPVNVYWVAGTNLVKQ